MNVVVAYLKYCPTVFLIGILSNGAQYLERPKDFMVQMSAEIIGKYLKILNS
jgi:hypothetical protein